MIDSYDIAIIGSGFAGSLLAMIAKRLGRSVLLLEKGSHPRVVIGESSTPLSNLLLEQLTARYNLPNLQSLSKWGSWQQSHPHVACGLKRGFTFHHHNLSNPAPPAPQHGDQLLVAASPHDDIADTHWYRADFDHLHVREAQAIGVQYSDRVELGPVQESAGQWTLRGKRNGSEMAYRARFLVDATGPRGFLHRAFSLEESPLTNYPATQALYSHFSKVANLTEGDYSRLDRSPPYPIDAAAVHHVFDGGWVWVLQFNNGITSAGMAVTDRMAAQLQLRDGAPAWQRLLDMIPALKQQFRKAEPLLPFTHMQRVAFRSSKIAGPNWALMPSAAGFVDPLLSTGFPLALLGITRLAGIIEHEWDSTRFDSSLSTYAAQADAELSATARLISALYSSMNNFPLFVGLSMLYFAAASYSEAARRLNKPNLASSFLLHDHPAFGPALRKICEDAPQVSGHDQTAALIKRIREAIEPLNVAGLARPERHNWYPVDPRDLIDSAWKLQSTGPEAEDLLRRCGFVL